MLKKNSGRIRIILAFILILSAAAVCVIARNTAVGAAAHARFELKYDKLDPYALDFSSHLPIVVIQVEFSSLVDRENPPLAAVWLFDGGGENRLTDVPVEVFNSATVNYRGVSSYYVFPKKSFMLKLYDDKNFYRPLDYGFFGLGQASEWVLRTPYADKSLLRDWFSYEIAATVLDWQPSGKPVQLFLQDGASGMVSYHGVYFLSERITSGETRLDIGQFNLKASERVDFDGGGYIFQRDRARVYSNSISLPEDIHYRLMHPRRSEMSSRQEAAFKDEIVFYHKFLNKTGEFEGIPEDDWNYWDYIDVDSFIDYYLFAELLMCADAGIQSTYMYRPVGGKLVMGPYWDGDLIMGNYDNSEQYYHLFRPLTRTVIDTLIRDKQFSARFAERWRELRSSIWTERELLDLFDSMAEYMAEPAAQNAVRWPEIYDGKTYIEYNPEPYVTSWDEEIERTRSWLIDRLEWLDENIPRLVYESAIEINDSYRELMDNEALGSRE